MGIFSIGGQPLTGPNNSFDSPFAMNNMQGAGWGVDPSSLTPSYAAGYRPHGQESAISSQRPGFWASTNSQFNPFAANPSKFSNPFEYNQTFRESLAPRAGDAAMFAAQVGVGVGAYSAGNSIWKSINYAGVARGSAAGFMQGNAARMGGRFAGGVARGVMGSSFGAGMPFTAGAATRGAITAGRVIGGVAGGFMGMAIGQGIIETFNAAVVDPYVNQRGTARDLRENLSGVTFGGGYGDPYHGRGLSFGASNQIAKDVTRSGFNNQSFSGADIRGIADKSSRLGMLDNIDPSKFAQQIKEITKQTAIIAAIANFANDPENIESLKIIARFKDAGISIKDTAKAFSTLSGHSSVAGISSARMSDLATQGQFMFSANGMTPGEGINRYAASYSSFAAARRNGLISDGLAARMGGPEGAAQASMTGMINASQTPYNQMIMANRYLGNGSQSGGIATDLGRFSGLFAKDPLSAMGAMGMYGGHMAEAQMKEQGPLAMQRQLMNMAKSMNMLNRDGTLDIHKAHLLATSPMMGMSNDAATASLTELMNAGNPKQYQNMLDGINSDYAKNRASVMDAEGTSGLAKWAQAKNQIFKPMGRYAMNIGMNLTSPISGGLSSAGDYISNRLNTINYGDLNNDDRGPQTVADLIGNTGSKGPSYKKLVNSSMFFTSSNEGVNDFVSRINKMAKSGDKLAARYTEATDPATRDKILKEMRKGNHAALSGMSSSDLSDLADQHSSGELASESVEADGSSAKTNKFARYKEEMAQRRVSYSDILAYNDENTSEAEKGRIEKRWTEKSGMLYGNTRKFNWADGGMDVLAGETNFNRSLSGSALGIAKELKGMYAKAVAGGYKGSYEEFAKENEGKVSGKYSQNSFGGDDRNDKIGVTASTAAKLQDLSKSREDMITKLTSARDGNRISGGDYFAKMAMASADKMNEAADKMLKAAGIKTPAEQAADAGKSIWNGFGRWGQEDGGSKSAGNPSQQAPQLGRSTSMIGAR